MPHIRVTFESKFGDTSEEVLTFDRVPPAREIDRFAASMADSLHLRVIGWEELDEIPYVAPNSEPDSVKEEAAE